MFAATEFDEADLALLLALYNNTDEPLRRPWCWSALTGPEREALARMIDVYVASYNHVQAIDTTDIIPPCWRQHAGLAWELAVQVWLWYQSYMDPKATPAAAAELHGRHLPGFRTRLARLLGRDPNDCRANQHPSKWRKADEQLSVLASLPASSSTLERTAAVDLGEVHFGFSHLPL